MGGRQPVVLLDTDLAENSPEDRELTHYLYGGDEFYRLKQEIILGIGGARMLHALGFDIRQYHMNEGHAGAVVPGAAEPLCLSRRRRARESAYDIPRVRELCSFTTRTSVEAGHDKFPYGLVQRVLGEFVDLPTLKRLAGEDQLNMTRLALSATPAPPMCADCEGGPGYERHATTDVSFTTRTGRSSSDEQTDPA